MDVVDLDDLRWRRFRKGLAPVGIRLAQAAALQERVSHERWLEWLRENGLKAVGMPGEEFAVDDTGEE